MIKSPGISLYNQDRFDDAEFVANFVARNELVNALLAGLRHIVEGGPTEHQILIGARGMGKTSLLRRIAIGISADPELKAAFIPLRFREEQYNIISLDAFWRNCGESLAEYCEQQGNQALADQLDIAIETPEWRDGDRARDAFLAACEQAGGRAILLLDNLDLILEGIRSEGCWSLRAALQKADGPIVIGAATQLLAQGGDRDAAFYEFFHPHMLEPLSERDLLACLNALADMRGLAGAAVKGVLAKEPERVRALYVLTGGNPRVLGLVYQLFEQADSETIFADLEALLDQVTPFYKARIEEYQTPLQRAVIDGIALNWDPITSGALAKETGVEATTLSGQLIRLKKDGLIEEVETSGTRTGYQLIERFLNIWYLMRHGTRKTKQRLRWFTIFLTKLFSADELQRMAGDARQGTSGRWHPDHCGAVIEAYEIKLQSEVSEICSTTDALLEKASRLSRSDKPSGALAVYDEVVASVGESDTSLLQRRAAMAMLNKGVTLGMISRFDDELAVYSQIIDRFGQVNAVEVKQQVARALLFKGFALGMLGRTEEGLAAYDEIVTRFGDNEAVELRVQVARSLINKGVRLGDLGRSEDAIAIYDDVWSRIGESDHVDLQEAKARALVNKGVRLSELVRYEDEIAIYDKVIAQFGESVSIELHRQVAVALLYKGITLNTLGRLEDCISTYAEVISRFGGSDDAELQEPIARALVNKGLTLSVHGDSEEQIALYDQVLERFGTSNVVDVERWVALALAAKGTALGALGRADDAALILADVIRRFGERSGEDFKEVVVRASVELGKILFWDLGRVDEGLSAVLEAVKAEPSDLLARASLLWMLVARGQVAEAKDVFVELAEITDGGRSLMLAVLDLAVDNLGSSLSLLSEALDQGLSGDFDYGEDLLWYLRIAAQRGHGERLIEWFDESSNAERYAPIYAAFVAHVRGERFLLDINPEVRGVAQPLLAKLAIDKRHRKPETKKGVRRKR